MKIEEINIKDIEIDKEQPRKEFEDIGQLASSILKEGLLEPLKVRKVGEKFILVDGERRFKALQLLNKSSGGYEDIVRCIVISSKDVFITQLSTDLHKRKLNPFEEAEAFKKLINEGWSIQDLKSRLGISGSIITRRIKLLGLSNRTKELIKKKILPQSVISEIDFRKFKDNEQQIIRRIGLETDFIKSSSSKRDKIRRIIKEETEKQEAVLNHLKIDLENFSRVINSYEFKLDEFKLDEFINEPIKDVQKVLSETLSKINKLVEIKDMVKKIEEQLNNLKIKYGEKTEISKEMFASQRNEVTE